MLRVTEIVDIGANPIDGQPPYAGMLAAGHCRVTGFEPQPEALKGLESCKGPNERYLPFVIGDGKEHTLHIAAASGMTSLLAPDESAYEMFPEFREWGKVVSTETVQTMRLDDIRLIETIDFLKIDAQGSELMVFQHGEKKLARTVAVQTEMSYVTLYKNQPTYGDVDLELRRQGFMPHCFAALKTWPRSSPQLLEADVVYIRNPATLDAEQLWHLARIAKHCYDSRDLASRCLALMLKW